MISRRQCVVQGGGLLAALSLPLATRMAAAAGIVEINMTGRPDGSRVWFDPVGLLLQPGQSVRWTNRDPGNSHTTTSYHPSLSQRSSRIPGGAAPWDSGYLLPGESFSVTLEVPGVYDYYCVPHEHAGMVGRIVVGELPADGWWHENGILMEDPDLPAAALQGFPAIEEIMAETTVRQK